MSGGHAAVDLLTQVAHQAMAQYDPGELSSEQLGQLNGLLWAIGLLLDPPQGFGVMNPGEFMRRGYRHLGAQGVSANEQNAHAWDAAGGSVTAQKLFDAAFRGSRSPRSEAYKWGVLAVLRRRVDRGPRVGVPYPEGTAEADAFSSGCDEGHRIAQLHGAPTDYQMRALGV